jgi:hypothetical protein
MSPEEARIVKGFRKARSIIDKMKTSGDKNCVIDLNSGEIITSATGKVNDDDCSCIECMLKDKKMITSLCTSRRVVVKYSPEGRVMSVGTTEGVAVQGLQTWETWRSKRHQAAPKKVAV